MRTVNAVLEKRKNMKTKIVLWGNDAEDKKVLLALELKPKDNKVDILSFSEDKVTEEFYNKMMEQWRSNKEVEFPEGYETITRELSMTEDILPETIKVQRADLINRAKTEWHFVVLSTKLYDLYTSELADLKDKIEKLIDYDGALWEEIKGFWSKISEQSRERNLFREHADKLRDDTNSLFTYLKELKTKANAELAKVSKVHVDTFSTRLDGVKEKVEKGMSLGPLFDELKKIQNEFKNADFTRNDRSKVWKKIDEAFKIVKEKKYGKAPANQQGAVSRIERRYQGLKSAIGKMEASIRRDKNDIDFQTKRANTTMGQLEMQIRQAKVKMVEERINSKQEKLDEMLATKLELEKKVEKEKARAEKNAEKAEIQKKKAELKKQIDSAVSSNAANLTPEEAAKLEQAASKLNKPKKAAKAAEPKAAEASATETVAEVKDAVVEQAEEVAAKAEASAKEVKASTENLKQAAEAKAETTIDDTIAKAESTLEQTKEAISDKAETVKSSLGKAGLAAGAAALGGKLMGKASEAKDALTDKAVEAQSVVTDKMAEAKEVGAEAKDAIVDKASEVKEAAKDKVADAKEAVADTKDALANKAEEAQSAVTDKMTDAKDAVAEAAEPKESMMGSLGKGGLLAGAMALGGKLMDKAEDVAEGMGVDVDGMKEKLSDAKDAVTEKTEDLVDSAKEKLEDAKGGSDTAEGDDSKKSGMGGMLAAGGILGAAVALGSKVVDSVSDKIEDAADSLGMGDAFDSAKEKLSDAKDAVSGKVDEMTGKAADATVGSDSVDSVADRVRSEAPLDLEKLEKNHKKMTSGEEE